MRDTTFYFTTTETLDVAAANRGRKSILGYKRADIAIWDPAVSHTYGANDLKDNVGYNPFEGTSITGLPVTVLSQGQIIVEDRRLNAPPGRGEWVPMTAAR